MTAARTCPPCHHCCSQGRKGCPVRDACLMTEPSTPRWFGLRRLALHGYLVYLRWARADMTDLHHPELHKVIGRIADIERELATK